jgi:hypothetical protein
MRDVAGERFDHGWECIESVRRRTERIWVPARLPGCSTGFDEDDESEWFAAGVFFEVKHLRDAVISEGEVAGVKGKDDIVGFVADEGGDEDES